MKRLIRAIKANYAFYVDVYERIWGSGNTHYEQQQKEEKKINDSKIIPFDPKRASKRNKFNNVRDVKEYDKKNQIK